MKNLLLALSLLVSVSSLSQTVFTTKEIMNKELSYDFGGFIIDINFSSDSTLYWKERKSRQDAHEKTKTIHINNHTILTGWYEEDKTFVALYSDFEKGETFGYQFRTNGKINPLKGTIRLKDSLPQSKNIKDEIWQLELNYWKYVKEQNLEAYLTLWDENFIGYPSNNIIGNKAHITDWIASLYKDKKRKFNYELNRKVENVFDDIVIVLYDVNYAWTNEKNEIVERSTTKITHTWKKTDKGWLIIGGMGATK